MYLIYGIQKSGLSIVNYFENKKIKFKMWDDNPIVRKAIKKNYNKDYFFNIKQKITLPEKVILNFSSSMNFLSSKIYETENTLSNYISNNLESIKENLNNLKII